MLIEHYDLEVFTPPCKPGAEPQYADRRAALEEIVIEAPAIGRKGKPKVTGKEAELW